MKHTVLLLLCLLLNSQVLSPVYAQERRVMRRPYVDQRRMHWGFLLGLQFQDLELRNNGYIDEVSGKQWYADVDNYNPGFTVGVLGELRLSTPLALRLLPTLHFGQRHISFYEQGSGKRTTQNLRSTYISLPLELKVAAPRYNNFRPYVLTGLAPSVDLSRSHQQLLRMRPFDCFFEIGAGCDIYLGFFKLIPELKFSFGILDVLRKNRNDLQDDSKLIFTRSIDAAHSKMLTFTLHFE